MVCVTPNLFSLCSFGLCVFISRQPAHCLVITASLSFACHPFEGFPCSVAQHNSLTHSPTFSHTLFLSLSLSVSLSLALYICLSMTLSCTHSHTLSPLSHRLLHSLIQSLCHSLAHIHLHLPNLSLGLYTISLLRTRFVTLLMSIYIHLPLRLYALCVLYSVTLSTFCPQNLSTNNNIFNNL